MKNLILPLICLLAMPAWAQQDPTAQDTLIEFGGAEALVIDTGETRHTFTVELAMTPDQAQRGLMWRDSLSADAGMLFVYDPARPASIWMENTQIPLDILYIRSDGSVAKIIAYAQPHSRRSLPSDFVVAGILEIAGGRSIELGIRPGAIVHHDVFNNAEEMAITDATAENSQNTAEESTD